MLCKPSTISEPWSNKTTTRLFLKPKTSGWAAAGLSMRGPWCVRPEAPRPGPPLTKLLHQRVLGPGLGGRLVLLLDPNIVVLEEVRQFVLEHRNVREGPHEGQLAVQVHLGDLQGWVGSQRPLSPCHPPSSLVLDPPALWCPVPRCSPEPEPHPRGSDPQPLLHPSSGWWQGGIPAALLTKHGRGRQGRGLSSP